MKYSRIALESALETRLGKEYMNAWRELHSCAIPELCNQYAIKGFLFLDGFDTSKTKFTFRQRMADYVVATALRELHESGQYKCGNVDDFENN